MKTCTLYMSLRSLLSEAIFNLKTGDCFGKKHLAMTALYVTLLVKRCTRFGKLNSEGRQIKSLPTTSGETMIMAVRNNDTVVIFKQMKAKSCERQ